MHKTHDNHIFKRFDAEMRQLHSLVVQMGEFAAQQLHTAVTTLKAQDVARAQTVVADDAKLNALDVAADDEVARIIALRQPMARDLREIIAVSKMVAELERAGDEARKIAGLTIRFYGAAAHNPPNENILRNLYELSAYVEAMLVQVMHAFDDLNLGEAAQVLEQGEKLDERLQPMLRGLTAILAAEPRAAAHFVDIVLGVRALERFGGHAKNIAGHIIFIKHGTDVRHTGVADILRQINRGE